MILLALLLAFCPPDGRAGPGGTLSATEAAQNRLKNRTGEPAHYEPVTVPMMLAAGPGRWAAGEGGELTGYVVRTKLAETESCNCWDQKARDVHLYIATSARVTDSRREVICEISPRTPLTGPRPKPGTHVAVRGWFFWDAHHAHEPGRGTAFEIHPVTSIMEVR